MAIIKDFFQKCKTFLALIERHDVYTALIIVLVGFAGFGMGRLSLMQEMRLPVTIENPFPSVTIDVGAIGQANVITGVQSGAQGSASGEIALFVGSRNGEKYHFPWCPSAQRIKEENKVWFSSREEAEKAGYEPAKNCKGL